MGLNEGLGTVGSILPQIMRKQLREAVTGPHPQSQRSEASLLRSLGLLPHPQALCAPQSRTSEEAGPPGLTTPVVHEDHPEDVLVGFGNRDWLSECVPRAYKESLS